MSEKTKITNRRPWDSGYGGEEVTIQVDGDSRLVVEMLDYSGHIISVIELQSTGEAKTEIGVERGRVILYS